MLDGNWSLFAPPGKKSLREQEYESTRHAMPKTRLTHAILHENPSQDRHLAMALCKVQYRRDQFASVHELSRRNFLDVQMRKQRKWKLEDETRRSSMKLPSISAAESLRPSSMMVLYHSPTYKGQSDLEDGHTSGMLPYMVLRKERTEILYHRNKSFITHFPTTILEDEKKLKKYKNFVNAKISAPTALADDRFKELKYALSPRITSSKLKKYQRKAPEEPEPCEDSDDSSCSSAPHFQRRITNFTDGRRSTKLVLPVLSRSKPGTGKSKHTVTEPSRLQREGASLQLVRNDTIEHTDRHTVENG